MSDLSSSGSTRLPSDAAFSEYPTLVYPYRGGAVGGLLGGLAMIVPAALYGLLSGRLWLPVNLIGATVVRDLQTATVDQLSQFNAPALVVGTIMHLMISVALGFVFALLLPALPGRPVLWAVVIGPLLFVSASLIVLPLINPVMTNHLEPVSFGAAHIVYGLVMGMWVARMPKVPAGRSPDAVGRAIDP